MFTKKGVTVDVQKITDKLKTTAEKLGLEFGSRTMTYNSRLAQETGLWAETEGKGHQFHIKAFRTYFVHGLNIGNHDVLMNLIESCGLDPVKGMEVIKNRLFSNAVDADWNLSRTRGVTAVPTFFVGHARLVGAQPYDALKKLVESGIAL